MRPLEDTLPEIIIPNSLLLKVKRILEDGFKDITCEAAFDPRKVNYVPDSNSNTLPYRVEAMSRGIVALVINEMAKQGLIDVSVLGDKQ